jgi:hypothetical protein
MALKKMGSTHPLSSSGRDRTFKRGAIFSSAGSTGAEVNRSKGGKAAFLPVDFMACLKIRNELGEQIMLRHGGAGLELAATALKTVG